MFLYTTQLYSTSGQHNAEHKFEITSAEKKFEEDLAAKSVEGWMLHSLIQRPSGDLYAVYQRPGIDITPYTDAEGVKWTFKVGDHPKIIGPDTLPAAEFKFVDPGKQHTFNGATLDVRCQTCGRSAYDPCHKDEL